MSRLKKDPLRPLTAEEAAVLARVGRSQVESAVRVARATMILAVARGEDYLQAARAAGRRSGVAVSHLVSRFNVEGLAALAPRHAGGQPRRYGAEAAERILREARRRPTPEADGAAAWSLSTLQKALRKAPTVCPTSQFTPSGGCFAKPAQPISAAVPGARPGPWFAFAKMARRWSPTPTPRRKKI